METVSSVLPTVFVPGSSSTSAASALGSTQAVGGTYSDARRRAETGDEPSRDAHDPLTGRRELFNYCLSLMHAHNGEHADTLPVTDVSSLNHIAYIFDALIYYIRSGNESKPYGDNDNADDYMSDVFNEPVRLLIKYFL